MTITTQEPSGVDRLRRAIQVLLGTEPTPEPEEPQSLSISNAASSTVAELARVFELERSRLQRLKDYEEMDEADIAAILDVATDACLISDDGTMVGFDVRVKLDGDLSGKKYQNIITQMLRDTGLPDLMFQYLRKTLKRGDTFIEIIPDEALNIRRLKSVPPDQMRVKVDGHGDLETGTDSVDPAFGGRGVQIPLAYRQYDSLHRPVAGWFPWEMVHIKWRPDDELIYSEGSFIEPIRRAWKRYSAVEDALTVARSERAFLREVHYLDTTHKDDTEANKALAEYKRNMTEKNVSHQRRAEWSRRVNTNLYIGRQHRQFHDRLYDDLTGVEVIDPRNTGLEHIPDVRLLREKLFSRVPGEVVGAGDSVGNDITQQDVAASKAYQYMQYQMAKQLIVPLCMMALKLKGYNPASGEIEVRWPNVIVRGSWRFSDARFRESMAMANYMEWGVISRKTVASDIFHQDDEEREAEVNQIKSEDDLPKPGGQGDTQFQRQGNQSA